MSATTTPAGTPTGTTDDASTTLGRVRGLARANALLMTRNRLTLFYALAMPLLPLALLFVAPRGDEGYGATVVTITVLMALLFPVYYNLLSLTVSRRDELVLKRLRTGEVRDGELIASMALPGCAVAVVVAIGAVPLALALGQPVPANLLLYAVTIALGALLLVALAVWTAAWTRNAEAAQMTSLPVFLLISLGFSATAYPEAVGRFVDLTPGAAIDALVRVSWFGQGPDGAVGFADSWVAAGQPLLVLAAWTAVGAWIGRRSMRWEPRR